MNGFAKALLGLFGIALLAGAVVVFMSMQFLGMTPSSAPEEVIFEVKPGEPFVVVARHLEEQKLVTNAWKLRALARVSGKNVPRVGEYALRRNMRPREILGILSSGRSIEYSITISEGLNRFEIADLVEKQKIATRAEFLEITSDRKLAKELTGRDLVNLEGYLFPETYHVTKYTGARGLVKLMVNRFKENYARLKATPGWGAVGLGDYEMLVLASIIEKETGAPDERYVISSVFHNRLRIKMPLQTDPTIIYGLWQASGNWNRNITRADLQTPGLYNSYLNQGLPPGPIANPGLAALTAAGAPAQTKYLFFVSRNNGTHVFSETYPQHQKAVAQFQLDRKMREGRSWRELSKKPAAGGTTTAPGAPATAPVPRTK